MKVYLDTTHWIGLSKAHYGKEGDPGIVETYNIVRAAAESGRTEFPISFFHLQEMMIQSDEERKKRLMEFLILISKGIVLKPYNIFMGNEVENAVLKLYGQDSPNDVKSQIFGRGVADLFGSDWSLVPANPDSPATKESRAQAEEKVRSPEAFLLALKMQQTTDMFKQIRADEMKFKTVMEETRLKKKQIEDKNQVYGLAITDFLTNIIFPHLWIIAKKHALNPKEMIHRIGENKATCEEFLQNIPSANVAFRVVHERDSLDRSIEQSDIMDINHLAGSVPYCDVVVFERMFGNIVKQKGLDRKYGSKILTNLKQLAEHLQ